MRCNSSRLPYRYSHQVLLRYFLFRAVNEIYIFILCSISFLVVACYQFREAGRGEVIERLSGCIKKKYIDIILIEISRKKHLSYLLSDSIKTQEQTADPFLNKYIACYIGSCF